MLNYDEMIEEIREQAQLALNAIDAMPCGGSPQKTHARFALEVILGLIDLEREEKC